MTAFGVSAADHHFCSGDATMADVLCLGETLIDFVPESRGIGLADAARFSKAAGGAPANVAAGVARQGGRAGFLGKVGDDPFGRYLRGVLSGIGVDVSGLLSTRQAQTALAFVSLGDDGEREFLFYRSPSADMLYAPADVPEALLAGATLLHVGTVSMIAEPSRSATLHAMRRARALGLSVSCDPNLRESLWPDPDAARDAMELALSLSDVVKISDYEVRFLTGDDDPVAGMRRIWRSGWRLVAVTMGPEGCTLMTARHTVTVPGFRVRAVDTTGAGDAFTATLLCALARAIGVPEDADGLRALAWRANAAGAIVATRFGAIASMPTAADIEAFLESEGWAQ